MSCFECTQQGGVNGIRKSQSCGATPGRVVAGSARASCFSGMLCGATGGPSVRHAARRLATSSLRCSCWASHRGQAPGPLPGGGRCASAACWPAGAGLTACRVGGGGGEGRGKPTKRPARRQPPNPRRPRVPLPKQWRVVNLSCGGPRSHRLHPLV